jgi:hypothetical protein
MRFITIWRPANAAGESTEPPTDAEISAMGALIQEMATAGILVATDGLLPSSFGLKVRRTNGEYKVIDGPFTESKELIAGYAIVDVASKEEALKWTYKFLDVAGDGESEIRQMHDQAAFAPA